jgi:apolipoprotein N-acyltransferase
MAVQVVAERAAAQPSSPDDVPVDLGTPVAAWRRLVPLVAAAGAGAMLTLAFPPYGVWPAAAVSVAVLTLLLRGLSARRGALVGFLFGLGFFVPLLHWSGVYVGAVPWLLLALLQAAFLAPMGALTALALRAPAWPLWVGGLWVAQEAARIRLPWGGFPWGRLAFSQADAPTVGLAALGGAPLVTFVVALTGALAAAAVLAAIRAHAKSGPAVAAGAAATVVAAMLVVAFAGAVVPVATPDGRQVTVAVVQGNVPRLGLDFNAQREAVLRNHAEATRVLAQRVAAGELAAPDLVVWPENASDIDPYANPSARALIDGAVQAIGVPTLVGAVVETEDGLNLRNSGIVWDPATGPGATYSKRHPVPFGEYIPLRRIARMLSEDVDRVRRDFIAGRTPGVLRVGPAVLADVICFEVGYDGVVRDAVRGGGQVVVVQTNNATFGFTPQSEQQLVMSRLRAVEHGRSVLVAATSGVSAVIGPDGRVVERAGLFTARTMVQRLTLSDEVTPAARAGVWPEALLALAGVGGAAGVAASAVRRRRERQPA